MSLFNSFSSSEKEYNKAPEHRRHLRLSRHLYDLYRIKNSAHATNALADADLFNTIVTHRKLFNAIRGISYENHTFQNLDFIPPAEVLPLWRQDYDQMSLMIFGERPSFDELVGEMQELLQKFRQIGNAPVVDQPGEKDDRE